MTLESKYSKANIAAFSTAEALDSYSVYRLTPIEKLLFNRHYTVGESVLDLACGAGRTTLCLHELGCRVKGIDIAEPLLNAARTRFPYLEFAVGSYTKIDSPPDVWDHVLISFNGLDYAHPESARAEALTECYRVLKAGGTLIFSTHNIKSFHCSPYYILWGEWTVLLRHRLVAFRNAAYVRAGAKLTFFASPEYVIKQTERIGFRLAEVVGFRNSQGGVFNRYCSPFIHYVFRKPPLVAVRNQALD